MNNIRKIMDAVNGATFISIDTSTNVKLRGGRHNLLQGRVRKVTVGSNVMVFQNKEKSGYGEMVKRRLGKEGKDPESFTVGPRTWGTRLEGIPFVEYKEKHYLEVIFLNKGTTHYEVDGVVTPKDQIEGIPESKPESSQGGLENKVIIRTFEISSITSVTINKQKFNGPFEFK